MGYIDNINGECGDEGQEGSRNRAPKRTQQPSTLGRTINYTSGTSYPLQTFQTEQVRQTQSSILGRNNSYSSGPPYPLRPLHPEPLQQTQTSSSGRAPYPIVPLHPMASNDNNNSSAIGCVIPSASGSQVPPGSLQTPPPSYEAATSDRF
ncbi:uncharacterized protein [Onthophagus taurus]|uniref:uncharacterized protein isoform X2 n=1 Tax=Onthophagus taurus TaxID=166361 RepID=UPI0039BDA440